MKSSLENQQKKLDKFKSNKSLIPAYQFFAIRKRYEGWPTSAISAEIQKLFDINVCPDTIRWWFYKGGPLALVYREYAEEMVNFEIETAKDFIRGNVTNAAKILAGVMMGKGGPAQVAAAKEFLDRGLGKTQENVKHSGTVGVAMLDVLKALKEAREYES